MILDPDIAEYFHGRAMHRARAAGDYIAISTTPEERAAFRTKAKNLCIHKMLCCPLRGLFVDHINRNKMDNRRENLRLVTHAQNMQNVGKRLRKDCFDVPLPKGVFCHQKRFRARIYMNGKFFALGVHDRLSNASSAYNQAARMHFGQYAYLNPED